MGTSGQMTSLPGPQFPIGFPRPPKGYPLAWLVSRLSVQSGDTTAINPRTGQDMGNRLGGQHAVAAARSQAKIPRGACWRHSCRAPSIPTGCAEPSVLGTGGRGRSPSVGQLPMSCQGSLSFSEICQPGCLQGGGVWQAWEGPALTCRPQRQEGTSLRSTHACEPCRERGHHVGGVA